MTVATSDASEAVHEQLSRLFAEDEASREMIRTIASWSLALTELHLARDRGELRAWCTSQDADLMCALLQSALRDVFKDYSRIRSAASGVVSAGPCSAPPADAPPLDGSCVAGRRAEVAVSPSPHCREHGWDVAALDLAFANWLTTQLGRRSKARGRTSGKDAVRRLLDASLRNLRENPSRLIDWCVSSWTSSGTLSVIPSTAFRAQEERPTTLAVGNLWFPVLRKLAKCVFAVGARVLRPIPAPALSSSVDHHLACTLYRLQTMPFELCGELGALGSGGGRFVDSRASYRLERMSAGSNGNENESSAPPSGSLRAANSPVLARFETLKKRLLTREGRGCLTLVDPLLQTLVERANAAWWALTPSERIAVQRGQKSLDVVFRGGFGELAEAIGLSRQTDVPLALELLRWIDLGCLPNGTSCSQLLNYSAERGVDGRANIVTVRLSRLLLPQLYKYPDFKRERLVNLPRLPRFDGLPSQYRSAFQLAARRLVTMLSLRRAQLLETAGIRLTQDDFASLLADAMLTGPEPATRRVSTAQRSLPTWKALLISGDGAQAALLEQVGPDLYHFAKALPEHRRMLLEGASRSAGQAGRGRRGGRVSRRR
jgi:hypothetical protein